MAHVALALPSATKELTVQKNVVLFSTNKYFYYLSLPKVEIYYKVKLHAIQIDKCEISGEILTK